MIVPEPDDARADSLRSLYRRYFVAFCALPIVFALLASAGWNNDSFPSWALFVLAGLCLVGIPLLKLGLRRMSARFEKSPPDETSYALLRKVVFWQGAMLPGLVVFSGARAIELPASVPLWIPLAIVVVAGAVAVVALSRLMILYGFLSDMYRNTRVEQGAGPGAAQPDQ